MSKNFIIRIKNKEDDIKIQKELFKRGYSWLDNLVNPSHLARGYDNYRIIFNPSNKKIGFSYIAGLYGSDYEIITIDKLFKKQLEFNYE